MIMRTIDQETFEIDPHVLLSEISNPQSDVLQDYAMDLRFPNKLDQEYFDHLFPYFIELGRNKDFNERDALIEFINGIGNRRHTDPTFLKQEHLQKLTLLCDEMIFTEIQAIEPSLDPQLNWVRIWNTFICVDPTIETKILHKFSTTNSLLASIALLQSAHLFFCNPAENFFKSLENYEIRPEMRARHFFQTGFLSNEECIIASNVPKIQLFEAAIKNSMYNLAGTKYQIFEEASRDLIPDPAVLLQRIKKLSLPE
jgi:hypothetical protein